MERVVSGVAGRRGPAASAPPRVALVHALRASIAPIERAFAEHWPDARQQHLLDDALPGDLERAGRVDDAITARFVALTRYAVHAGADAVLFTCSAFGSAIDAAAAAVEVPVAKPNDAMLERAARTGGEVALVATFAPTLASMLPEAVAVAARLGADVRWRPVHVEGALAALSAGDAAAHDDLVAAAVAAHAGDVDVVALTQFSLARVQARLRTETRARVLTTPDAAVLALRARVRRPEPAGSIDAHHSAAAVGRRSAEGNHTVRDDDAFVTPADLRAQRDGERPPLVLDVRSRAEFEEGHVEGALHLPIEALEGRVGELPRDRPIVPYCNMFHPGASRGERARDMLRDLGLDARTLLGGYPAWRDAPADDDAE